MSPFSVTGTMLGARNTEINVTGVLQVVPVQLGSFSCTWDHQWGEAIAWTGSCQEGLVDWWHLASLSPQRVTGYLTVRQEAS